MAALKGYLTAAEVAERLGLGVNRVYQFIWSGRLEAVRVGGKTLLVSETAVKRFKRQPPGRPRKKPGAPAARKTGGRTKQ